MSKYFRMKDCLNLKKKLKVTILQLNFTHTHDIYENENKITLDWGLMFAMYRSITDMLLISRSSD